MAVMPIHKYRAFKPVGLRDRTWPDREITRAPIWCSVDLRDGNQALVHPMGIERKMRMFKKLIEIGYKEIEVGFPAASSTDYDFLRHLIEEDHIPDDVTIQVLTQARDHLIESTFKALENCKNAIVHFYNSTSTLQRQVVFDMSRDEICDIALKAARKIKSLESKLKSTHLRYQYSPESFTQTELDFSCEVCSKVMDILGSSVEKPVILNLPATVEACGPHIYADQIEWMHRNLPKRDHIILSLHPHNDRGCGVAAAEFGLMAGADRIEGTLFGNGERTGNVDLVTLGMNMVSQGVDAGIDFSDMKSLVEVAQYCNQLDVPERHPYAGLLVFTAFSGSHQDAINKGMKAMDKRNSQIWEVPYLPIDPRDVGANYEAVIRINSQSGKGGIAWVLEKDYGLRLPKKLQIEFSNLIQGITDDTGQEITSIKIWECFCQEYIERQYPYHLIWHKTQPATHASEERLVNAKILFNNKETEINGSGSGPIDGLLDGLIKHSGIKVEIVDYVEHAIGVGSDTKAASYIEAVNDNGQSLFGVGIDSNITTSSLKALISIYNRLWTLKGYDDE
ncbi:MAG: 2-isopropylmalate synthase [Pseudomonadota bacterium]